MDTHKELLEKALYSIGDGVILADESGSIQFLNEAAGKITGWSMAEAHGKAIDEVFCLFHSTTETIIPCPIEPVLKNGVKTGLSDQILMITKDGRKRYVSATLTPIRTMEGEIKGIVMVFRDIHRYKILEEQLRNERNNFQTILESTPVGMLLLDQDAVIRHVNHNLLQKLHFQLSDLKDKKIGDGFRCINSLKSGCGNSTECNLCEIRKHLQETMLTRDASNDNEIRLTLYTENGVSKPWFKVNYIPVILAGKQYVLLAMDDISKQKEREDLLIKAKEQLEEANRAKSEFLASMSHEIRTPMNGIIGMIDLTLMSGVNDDQKENLKIAKNSADALLHIINDILEFSKLEAGRLKIQTTEFEIHKLLENTVKPHFVLASQKGLSASCVMEAGIPALIAGDPDRLRQILNNLLSNAVKFTEEGLVRISIAVEEETDQTVVLLFQVTDSGIGIPESAMIRLFQRFSQVDRSYTKKYGGTGLGLAICRQLAECMNGSIWAESNEGVGSTFYLRIPFDKIKDSEPVSSQSYVVKGSKETMGYEDIPETDGPDHLLQMLDFLHNLQATNQFDRIEQAAQFLKDQFQEQNNDNLKEVAFKLVLAARREASDEITQYVGYLYSLYHSGTIQ